MCFIVISNCSTKIDIVYKNFEHDMIKNYINFFFYVYYMFIFDKKRKERSQIPQAGSDSLCGVRFPLLDLAPSAGSDSRPKERMESDPAPAGSDSRSKGKGWSQIQTNPCRSRSVPARSGQGLIPGQSKKEGIRPRRRDLTPSQDIIRTLRNKTTRRVLWFNGN